MKEKPILFSGPMVRAILEGRKTMTRRVIKPHPLIVLDGAPVAKIEPRTGEFPIQRRDMECPYGQVGDRLWVRETFAENVAGCPNGISYRADHNDPKGDGPAHPMKWKPSIFMRRKDSRITLEITDVRVERLTHISPEDCRDEGMSAEPPYPNGKGYAFKKEFHQLWDKLNAKRGYSWDSNPWVWVISFKRV